MKSLLLFLTLFTFACHNGDSQSKTPDNEPLKPEANSNSKTEPLAEIIIDNPKDYSESFIKILREQKQFTPIHLAGDSMTIGKMEAIPFPNVPMLDEEVVFRGNNKDFIIDLVIKRINQSTISYELEVQESPEKFCKQTGMADMSPYFFLGAETDINEITEEAYFSLEYSNQKEDCYTNLRIGISYEIEEDGVYLAKVISNCLDDCSTIELEKTPVLYVQD